MPARTLVLRERNPQRPGNASPDRGFAECCTTLLEDTPEGFARRRVRADVWKHCVSKDGGLTRRDLRRSPRDARKVTERLSSPRSSPAKPRCSSVTCTISRDGAPRRRPAPTPPDRPAVATSTGRPVRSTPGRSDSAHCTTSPASSVTIDTSRRKSRLSADIAMLPRTRAASRR